MEKRTVLGILSSALFSNRELPDTDDWLSVYNELNCHAVIAITAEIVDRLDLPKDLKATWKTRVLQIIIYNMQYRYIQDSLPISVPYIILKGTSAAQYYPHPEYRTMGDIDIMTKKEDYESACNELLQNGFNEISYHEEHAGRHRCFVKQGIIVEVHLSFAMLKDKQKAEYLDELIVNNINSSHILPDLINGLTILEHIYQHLEEGLGLRQIIDWMMFVEKCLTDDQWQDFNKLVLKTGLDKLAIVTTRMCEIYFGLPKREWCKAAEDKVCKQLMEYVLSNGNFGKKKTSDSDISENVLAYARNPKSIFKLLQNQGLINWKASQKYKILRPFAWVYQMGRYIFRGLKRERAISQLKEEFTAAKRRNAMFDELGV